MAFLAALLLMIDAMVGDGIMNDISVRADVREGVCRVMEMDRQSEHIGERNARAVDE